MKRIILMVLGVIMFLSFTFANFKDFDEAYDAFYTGVRDLFEQFNRSEIKTQEEVLNKMNKLYKKSEFQEYKDEGLYYLHEKYKRKVYKWTNIIKPLIKVRTQLLHGILSGENTLDEIDEKLDEKADEIVENYGYFKEKILHYSDMYKEQIRNDRRVKLMQSYRLSGDVDVGTGILYKLKRRADITLAKLDDGSAKLGLTKTKLLGLFRGYLQNSKLTTFHDAYYEYRDKLDNYEEILEDFEYQGSKINFYLNKDKKDQETSKQDLVELRKELDEMYPYYPKTIEKKYFYRLKLIDPEAEEKERKAKEMEELKEKYIEKLNKEKYDDLIEKIMGIVNKQYKDREQKLKFLEGTKSKIDKVASKQSNIKKIVILEYVSKKFDEEIHDVEDVFDEDVLFELNLDIDDDVASDTLLASGNAYYDSGDYDRASMYYVKLLQVNSSYSTGFYSKGNSIISNGDYETALKFFNELLSVLSDNKDFDYGKGYTLYMLKQYESAITYFEKVLESEPENINSLLYKGISNYELGDCGEALVSLEKVLELSPGNTDAVEYKGKCSEESEE